MRAAARAIPHKPRCVGGCGGRSPTRARSACCQRRPCACSYCARRENDGALRLKLVHFNGAAASSALGARVPLALLTAGDVCRTSRHCWSPTGVQRAPPRVRLTCTSELLAPARRTPRATATSAHAPLGCPTWSASVAHSRTPAPPTRTTRLTRALSDWERRGRLAAEPCNPAPHCLVGEISVDHSGAGCLVQRRVVSNPAPECSVGLEECSSSSVSFRRRIALLGDAGWAELASSATPSKFPPPTPHSRLTLAPTAVTSAVLTRATRVTLQEQNPDPDKRSGFEFRIQNP